VVHRDGPRVVGQQVHPRPRYCLKQAGKLGKKNCPLPTSRRYSVQVVGGL
jgi:hypothetical protein